MVDRPLEPRDTAIDDQPLMHEIVGEARPAAAEQAADIIRRPATMPDHLSAKTGTARQFVGIRVATRDRRTDLGGGLGLQPLIGIERKHPVAFSQRQCAILLRAKTRPVHRGHHPRAAGFRHFDGIVGAAAVDDDKRIGKRNRAQAALDHRLLVLGNDDDGQTRQGDTRRDPNMREYL